MRHFFLHILSVLILLQISGCSRLNGTNGSANVNGASAGIMEELNPTAYVQWCEDPAHGLQKNKEIEDLTYSLFYKPAEFIVTQEEQTDHVSAQVLKKKMDELDGLDYYDFKIQLTNDEGELLKHKLSSVSEYQDRLNYFSFNMQQDIKMIEGIDTVSCALFHFERAYDVAPYAIFLLGFPKSGKDLTSKTFFYQDNVFHKGIIKFTFTKDELTSLPKLKTI
ncbi:MAG: hypothetical protein ACHQII_00015 [Bacteroidia bacterium]